MRPHLTSGRPVTEWRKASEEQQRQGVLKVTVALTTDSGIEFELGEMLLDTLANLGCCPTLVLYREAKDLEADILLLVGDCLQFDGYANLLGRAKERRPTTMLWQLHSLPPPTLSARVERKGMWAVELDRVGLPPRSFSEMIKLALPVQV